MILWVTLPIIGSKFSNLTLVENIHNNFLSYNTYLPTRSLTDSALTSSLILDFEGLFNSFLQKTEESRGKYLET